MQGYITRIDSKIIFQYWFKFLTLVSGFSPGWDLMQIISNIGTSRISQRIDAYMHFIGEL